MAGCGSVDERSDAAARAAERFVTAVGDGDGTAACALLAPGTLDEVEGTSGTSCAEAVTDQDLGEPGPATAVAVYGQWAKVQLGDQAVFLAMFPGGWRVVAAGCRPRGERPFACELDGGG